MLSVQRDPFMRGEYVRICQGAGVCQWCGQKRKRVFTYQWQNDSTHNRLDRNEKTFCNFECFSSYSG